MKAIQNFKEKHISTPVGSRPDYQNIRSYLILWYVAFGV
jgi:hypothetical protein